MPEIDTPRRYRNNPWSTGTCYRWRIVLTFGGEYPDAAATLLHELAHSAAPVGEGHGEQWKTIFQSAARALYPGVDFKFHELPRYPTRQQVQAAVTRGISTVANNHDTVSAMREAQHMPVEA